MWFRDKRVIINAQEKEKMRYDLSAASELRDFVSGMTIESGLNGIPVLHLPPFLGYYSEIRNLIRPHHKVLELAAGTGRHTPILVETGAEVYALDISAEALSLLRIRTGNTVKTICASMDNIPLFLHSFDFVVQCGGMSYVSNSKLLLEIKRILKPSGGIIFLDTLNHNSIYRANRFIQFLRGQRTFPTLYRMPTLAFVNQIRSNFEYSTLKTFGNFLWFQHLSTKYFGTENPKILTYLEKKQNPRGALNLCYLAGG